MDLPYALFQKTWCAIAWACALASVLALHADAALAAKRVALVIGISKYEHIATLENPKKDAELIASVLKELDFALIGDGPQIDLDKLAFERLVQQFGRSIAGADAALFYFAGHGVQVNGNNYLIPSGANPVREADVDFEMLNVDMVLRQMEGSGSKLNMLILDACRNNPFGGRGFRSASSGLAQMQAPEGTIISFATQPGNIALDGEDGNSPYTRALADALRKPGRDVFRTFNEVGVAVSSATAGQQQPWISLSPIRGEFYFAPPRRVIAASQVASRRSPEEAEAFYRNLRLSFPNLLEGRTMVVQRTKVEAKGVFFRVLVLSESGEEADSLCRALKAEGIGCFVLGVIGG